MTAKMTRRGSVILVSYNSLQDLMNCLPSLLPSLSYLDELIIVDNASTDGSVNWLSQYYPQVRLVMSNINRGFGAGANLGALNAKGKYLAFLNPDTRVNPGWIDALVGALDNDTAVGLATSKILLLGDPDRINTCGNDMHISGITLCRGMGLPREALKEREEVSAISGTSFIIRRDLFDMIGGFDEHYFMYMEDSDLSLRARLAGYKCLYVPESIVLHDYSLSFGPKKTYYEERNRYIMLLKSLRKRTLFVLIPILLLAEVVTWGFSVLRDRKNLSNKIQAYNWIIKNREVIFQERQKVQSYRQINDKELLKITHHQLGYEQTVSGPLHLISHFIFDPFFFILKKIVLIF
jgi:GT2 family glycosyltransferase